MDIYSNLLGNNSKIDSNEIYYNTTGFKELITYQNGWAFNGSTFFYEVGNLVFLSFSFRNGTMAGDTTIGFLKNEVPKPKNITGVMVPGGGLIFIYPTGEIKIIYAITTNNNFMQAFYIKA